MAAPPIRFDDGAAYEQGMGRWSRLAGEIFLDWLAPGPGLRWLDVGCGSGAFTELIMQRHAPAEAHGLDPSPGQLAFARERPGARGAVFQQGDAMALPFQPDRFDAAVMALVIFFVPEPATGVAEMARVVRPGGTVAAYAWDMASGGFPFVAIREEMRAAGLAMPDPPSADASRLDTMRALWGGAGLDAVETRQIAPRRTFASFDEFWSMSTGTTGVLRQALAALAPAELASLKERVRARLPADADGSITYAALANAIKGRVPS